MNDDDNDDDDDDDDDEDNSEAVKTVVIQWLGGTEPSRYVVPSPAPFHSCVPLPGCCRA